MHDNAAINEKIFEIEDRYWWYRARREIIVKLAGAHCRPGTRVLNLGCGTGADSARLEGQADFFNLDYSRIALGFCRRKSRGHSLCAGAEHLPLQESAFRLVLCLDVLEHLVDDCQALREIHRVLEQDQGRLLLTVPAFESLRDWRDEVAGHLRRYRRATLLALLEECGFEPLFCSYFSSLLLPAFLLERLLLPARPPERREHFPSGRGVSNFILEKVFLLEKHFLPRPGFPVGKSLICLSRPRRDRES